MKKSLITRIATITGLTLGAFAISVLASDWAPPLNAPPTCVSGNPGCDAPLNVGALPQVKNGSLSVGAFSALQDSSFGQNVGIGNKVPLTSERNITIGSAVDSPVNNGYGYLNLNSATANQSQVRFYQNDALKSAIYTMGGDGILRFYNKVFGDVMTLNDAGVVDVKGTIAIKGGNPQPGNVLTSSDTNGTASWQPSGGGVGGGGVTKITAGSHITISPADGIGNVTISTKIVTGTKDIGLPPDNGDYICGHESGCTASVSLPAGTFSTAPKIFLEAHWNRFTSDENNGWWVTNVNTRGFTINWHSPHGGLTYGEGKVDWMAVGD